MANSKQSIKRARQNADRYKLKHSQRSQARTAVKAVRNAIAENNKESAAELLKTAQKLGGLVILLSISDRVKKKLLNSHFGFFKFLIKNLVISTKFRV